MKKTLLSIALISTFITSQSHAGQMEAGFQYSYPVYGLSLKKDLSPTSAAQVVANTGIFSGIYGRYIHKFDKTKNKNLHIQPFAYGQVGLTMYDYSYYLEDKTETSYSIGVGGGVELVYPEFTDKLAWTIEGGIAHSGLKYYNLSAFMLGGGLHYKFNY